MCKSTKAGISVYFSNIEVETELLKVALDFRSSESRENSR